MPSLISLPLSLILRGTKHLAIGGLIVADALPPPLIKDEVEIIYEAKAAHRFNVKYEVKVTHKAKQLLDHNFLFLDKAKFEFLFGYDPTGREEDPVPASSKTPLSNPITYFESSPPVREKFTLYLVLLTLSLLEDYNTRSAIYLLEKNQDRVL
ncbi:hypothetical protein F5882DRAFT_376733 [Hyaloscypha sp. PMI_1271]|nr:hypothetical protein F5882DRAFT_376733 [Hyaloscypha sp. PMI_1271]